MPTDVSSFKDVYKTAIASSFPEEATLILGDQQIALKAVATPLRYGTNPHQPFTAFAPKNSNALSVGNLDMLKGGKAGLSLTNLQDMSQALNTLKYFQRPACVVMKHVNPCGFKVQTTEEPLEQIYRIARDCDARSAFGGIVGFNTEVDAATAEAIMETFIEGVIAPAFSAEALEVLRRNEGTKKRNNAIRVARVDNLHTLPKFIGDDITGLYNIRNLVDGTLTFEIPYLTRVRGAGDLILDPMIPNSDPEKNNGRDYVVSRRPTAQEIEDCLTAWYININVRSNGIVFVKNGAAIAVGTGEQERIGAVEQAIDKAVKKGHDLQGSVMSSDAFFPQRDCIDTIAALGVRAVIWPAGSLNDAAVIEAAAEHDMALMATLERCFLHI
jgi:phosphoribosylaminoimidazolecarboxamide formyltransferase / IMP cyclohydrolase